MKTFLGFTTGLLGGTLAGVVFMAALFISFEPFREYMNCLADETDDA